MAKQKHRLEHWGSQTGVILAVAGSAVGLGNFLRFPGQVVTNGGGAFMIPYLISLLVVAIPLSMTEWALGRFAGRRGFHSQMGMFYLASGRSRGWGMAGGLMALVPFVINMYYVFIEAWCLLYALQYLGGTLEPIGLGFSFFEGIDPGLHFETSEEFSAFFGNMVGKDANGALFTMTSPLLLATIFCVLGNLLLILRGISGGVEKVCKLAAPLVLICSLFIIVRVVTFGNPTGLPGRSVLDGLGFMWNPSRDVLDASGAVVGHTTLLESLKNPDVWLAATAQIFFTVSLCWCSVSTYASYLRKKDDIALSSLSATATNEFCEVVLGGLITVPPAIMFLGAANAQEGFTSSFAMGFSVLANVFDLTPFGQFFGFTFYLILFTAAITTSVSLIQPTVALFQEAFKWDKTPSVLLVGVVNIVGTFFVCWFSKDLIALNVFDFWVSGVLVFIFALLQTWLVAFVWGTSKLQKEIAFGASIKPPTFLANVVKFVSFPYMAIIVIFWMVKNLGRRIQEFHEIPVVRYVFVFFALLAAGLLILSGIVTKRWATEGKARAQENETTPSLDTKAENN